MVWDILSHAASFDFAWLLDTAFANIHWIFVFAAVSHIFFEGQKPIRAFIHVAFAGMFFAAFLPFVGWQDFVGPFLLFYYLADLSLLKFAETIPFFAKRLVWVEEFTFFGCLIVFNLILG